MKIGQIEAVNSTTGSSIKIESWDTEKKQFQVTIENFNFGKRQFLIHENVLQYILTQAFIERNL